MGRWLALLTTTLVLVACGRGGTPAPALTVTEPPDAAAAGRVWLREFNWTCAAAPGAACRLNHTIEIGQVAPGYELCRWEAEAASRPWPQLDGGLLRGVGGETRRNSLGVRADSAAGEGMDVRVRVRAAPATFSDAARRELGCIHRARQSADAATPMIQAGGSGGLACACVHGADAQGVAQCLVRGGDCRAMRGVTVLTCVETEADCTRALAGRCPSDQDPSYGRVSTSNSRWCAG